VDTVLMEKPKQSWIAAAKDSSRNPFKLKNYPRRSERCWIKTTPSIKTANKRG
jgi:hypothetical protein